MGALRPSDHNALGLPSIINSVIISKCDGKFRVGPDIIMNFFSSQVSVTRSADIIEDLLVH